MQQRPTCTDIRIRSTRDAHKIFFAVQHRMLPMITRRLDADERLALRSGCVYAWEERGPHTEITGLGIERFTEGRRWSPSRVRDEFLFYYEKYTPPPDAGHSSSSDKQPPRDWDPLVKQTYSVWVETEKGRRKWHLTAYFTQATVDQLGTIDDIPGVADLVVPDGAFQSTRVSKGRKGDDARARSDVLKPSTSSVTRTYAAFSAAYPAQPSPYPGPSTPVFAQDPYRLNPQPSLSSSFQQPAETSQYSIPPPLPSPAGDHHPLTPLKAASEDIDYKLRRPSLPAISDYHPASLTDRRPSADYGSSPLYPSGTLSRDRPPFIRVPHDFQSRTDQYPLVSNPSQGMSLPTSSSSLHDRMADYPPRSSLPYTYATSPSRSPPGSPSSHHRPPSTVGTFQPAPKSADAARGLSNPYSYSPHVPPTVLASPHNVSQVSLPPPAELLRPDPPAQLYEVTGSEDSAGVGPCRVDLAPLHSLQRNHPYRRDPVDDKALRLLGPRSG
ncbi:Gti1/Pac2 family-domain-containing protein [Phlebopus sp. FC_14]|nr:Gti1/Pac2 family-domain-containing protein [Phlebopus sp. FC_14]